LDVGRRTWTSDLALPGHHLAEESPTVCHSRIWKKNVPKEPNLTKESMNAL